MSQQPGEAGAGVSLEPVANGVSRVSWTPQLQHRGFEVASLAVREQVQLALDDLKQARVEAWIDPDDTAAARIATWAGMHREGVMRGGLEVSGQRVDRVVYARVAGDAPIHDGPGFRSLLNSFLPRKRAISQLLVRDPERRVLLCQLTYKRDWDLPGGVAEVGESPRRAAAREVEEELGLDIVPGPLLLADWLPPWSGWDDAVCLVFDGGVIDPAQLERLVVQPREIRSVALCTLEEVRERCADFTARRVVAALGSLDGSGPSYTESGR